MPLGITYMAIGLVYLASVFSASLSIFIGLLLPKAFRTKYSYVQKSLKKKKEISLEDDIDEGWKIDENDL